MQDASSATHDHDATDRAAHWTHELTEKQMNAVLDAINAGQAFDHVLKRIHTSLIPDI